MLTSSVPGSDGSVDRAFAEVDAKLVAWSEAMRDAHAALERMVARAAGPVVAVEPTEADAGPVAAAPGSCGPQAAASRHDPKTTCEQPGRDGAIGERPGKPPTGGPAPHAPAIVETAPRVDEVSRDTDAPAPEADEDEAVLALLDEETATAVRIMRRLAPGTRSVRELVEEYRSSRAPAGQPPPQKRSWWGRGKK